MAQDIGLIPVPAKRSFGGILGSVLNGLGSVNQRFRDAVTPVNDPNDPAQRRAQANAETQFGMGLLSGQRPIDSMQGAQANFNSQLEQQAAQQQQDAQRAHVAAIQNIFASLGAPPAANASPDEQRTYLRAAYGAAVRTGDPKIISSFQGMVGLLEEPKPGHIDPLSAAGVAAQLQVKAGTPHNIDPNSPAGIAARIQYDQQKPKTAGAQHFPAVHDLYQLDRLIAQDQTALAKYAPNDPNAEPHRQLLAGRMGARDALELNIPEDMRRQRIQARVIVHAANPYAGQPTLSPAVVMAQPPAAGGVRPTVEQADAALRARGLSAAERVIVLRKNGYNVQ